MQKIHCILSIQQSNSNLITWIIFCLLSKIVSILSNSKKCGLYYWQLSSYTTNQCIYLPDITHLPGTFSGISVWLWGCLRTPLCRWKKQQEKLHRYKLLKRPNSILQWKIQQEKLHRHKPLKRKTPQIQTTVETGQCTSELSTYWHWYNDNASLKKSGRK